MIQRDIFMGGSGGPTDENKHILEKYLYWTEGEVSCYNQAIDDAIGVVRSQFLSMSQETLNVIIGKLNEMKK